MLFYYEPFISIYFCTCCLRYYSKLEMTLDVYCYPNEPPNHVKVTLKDVDGVLEKMDEVAGFTGDIKIQYLEKIMQFDGNNYLS